MKAVLVIDVDDDFDLSQIHANVELYSNELENTFHKGYLLKQVRPLPQKKNEEQYQDFGNGTSMYWTSEVISQNKGYNACLDEILGEEK